MSRHECDRSETPKDEHLVALHPATIRRQLEELKRVQQSLEAILAAVEGGEASGARNAGSEEMAEPANSERRRDVSVSKRQPLRTVVLAALQDLECPAYTRELSLYCRARYGREIAPTRFGTLAADEEKTYLRPNRQPRSLWLSFALTFDRYQPIKRLMTRSDWPLEMRIVAPTTGRIQHLMMTRRLCELALEAGDSAANPEMMRIIAADHARDVPGLNVKRGEFDLEGWRNAADALLVELLSEDERIRRESAERLAAMQERIQLFGTYVDVLEGGRRDRQTLRGEA